MHVQNVTLFILISMVQTTNEFWHHILLFVLCLWFVLAIEL